MLPSRYWPRRSVGATPCTRIFPKQENSLPHIARLIDECVIESFDERVLRAACELGAPPSDLEFILSRTTPNWGEVVKAAAKSGYLHVLQSVKIAAVRGKLIFTLQLTRLLATATRKLSSGCMTDASGSIHGYSMAEAIAHGHLPVVKWQLHEGAQLKDFDRKQLRLAAQNGHLKTVQWIHENFKDTDTSYAMEGVATIGDLEMLQWLHHQKRCSTACFSLVMNGGHFHVVEWLFENYSQSSSGYAAERAGNLSMLQWLYKQYNTRLGSGMMDLAASEGHLETVKWLHEHESDGCTPHARTMAACYGHLDVLQWLHANQTEGWTAYVLDLAAGGGHLDIVKWLHENRPEGCTDLGMDKAVRNGHAHVLRWLVEHYPDRCGENLMAISGWEGYLDVVQYLEENTKQRASGWGLGAAAKRGWMKTLLVLIPNYYRGRAVDCYGLRAVSKAFDEILTQLSNQPKSSLWREFLESLELFHSCGYYSCVSLMLERALRRGEDIWFWFSGVLGFVTKVQGENTLQLLRSAGKSFYSGGCLLMGLLSTPRRLLNWLQNVASPSTSRSPAISLRAIGFSSSVKP